MVSSYIEAAFNFILSPHQLNDGTVNLTTGGYSGISDLSLNYLPYHESLYIDYRNQPSGAQPNWTTLTTTNLGLAGTPKPNLYNQTIGAYFVAGTGTITGNYGPICWTTTSSTICISNENSFNVGTNQFQFRIYLKINLPKYYLPRIILEQ